MVTIDELVIADPPEAWEAIGFAVEGEVARVGSVRLRFAGRDAGDGIVGWSLRDVMSTELDGLPTRVSNSPLPDAAPEHPNGAVSLDHVVVNTPDLDRTNAALEAADLSLRRVREAGTPENPLRMAFFRLGEVILEVVGPAGEDGPARFWGLVVVVEDLDAAAELLDDRLGTIRDAVQPGRRIATVRRDAGLGSAVALMTASVPT